MKRFFTYGIALALCTFFLLAGTGMNIVHYCCNNCREAGIVHVTEESCEMVHEEMEEGHSCCHHHHDKSCHHNNCCWFKHMQVEDGGISSTLSIPDAEQMQVLHCIVPTECKTILQSVFSRTRTSVDSGGDTPPKEGRQTLARGCKLVI